MPPNPIQFLPVHQNRYTSGLMLWKAQPTYVKASDIDVNVETTHLRKSMHGVSPAVVWATQDE